MEPRTFERCSVKKYRAGFFSRTTADRGKHGLEKQQDHARSSSGDSQTTLTKQRGNDEVQGHEKADGFKGDAARPSSKGASGGKELDGAMRHQQHAQGEKYAAGVEAPRQQDSGNENGVIVEVDCGG